MKLEIKTTNEIVSKQISSVNYTDLNKEWVSVVCLKELLNCGLDALDVCEVLRKEIEKQ
jgi:hypothetical protein